MGFGDLKVVERFNDEVVSAGGKYSIGGYAVALRESLKGQSLNYGLTPFTSEVLQKADDIARGNVLAQGGVPTVINNTPAASGVSLPWWIWILAGLGLLLVLKD